MHLAASGRPGPCWLDVPLDVQAAQIDPAGLRGYDPDEDRARLRSTTADPPMPGRSSRGWKLRSGRSSWSAAACARRCTRSVRRVIRSWGSGRHGVDRRGPHRQRRSALLRPAGHHRRPAGNFAVQNADLLLVIGCRLNIRQISYNWRFARQPSRSKWTSTRRSCGSRPSPICRA